MVDAGIHPGDYVIVRKNQAARPNDQIYKNLEKSKAKVKRIGAHQSYWYMPEVTPDIEAYLRSVS